MQRKWNSIVNFDVWEALDYATNQYLYGVMEAFTCVGSQHKEHEQLF